MSDDPASLPELDVWEILPLLGDGHEALYTPTPGTPVEPHPDDQFGEGYEQFDPRDYVEIIELNKRTSRKYKTLMTEHKIKFRNLETLPVELIFIRLTEIFDYLVEQLTVDKGFNQVRFAVNSPSLQTPINLNFMAVNELSGTRIIDAIYKVDQSRRGFYLDNLTVYLLLMRMDVAVGSGYRPGVRRRALVRLEDYIEDQRCVLKIKTTDNICMARGIVLGQIYARIKHGEVVDSKYKRQMLRDVRRMQTRAARELHDRAGIPYEPCGLEEARLFQDTMSTEYRLVIFSAPEDFEIIFKGPPAKMNVYLLYHSEHYSVVVSPRAMFGAKGFCELCLTAWYNAEHFCTRKCYKCKQPVFHERTAPKLCDACHRWFNNQRCFDIHISAGTCRLIGRCLECGNEFSLEREAGKKHSCVNDPCKQCATVHKKGLCFVKPQQPPEQHKFRKVFFDTETFQREGTHVAILCVASFEQRDGTYVTKKYYGLDCMKQFLDELLATETVVNQEGRRKRKKRRPKHRDMRILSHNGAAFDSMLVLQYLYEHSIRPEVIFTGSKIIFLELPGTKIRFLDTYCFVPLPLRGFNKAFDLGPLAKTFFPYSFMTEETLDYVGPLPDRGFFQSDHFKPEDAAAFDLWYAENAEKEFDLKKTLIDYCVTDVEVLTRGFDAFLRLFEGVTGINPLTKNVTLASICSTVLLTKFLKPRSLGIVPYQGYRALNNQSLFGMRCIRYYENKFDTNFVSALSPQGEFRVGPFFLDAVCHSKRIILEANGCLFHGHPKCYGAGYRSPLTGEPMAVLYDRTQDRLNFIAKQLPDYQIVTVWECDFDRKLAADPEDLAFVQALDLKEPISSREALAGDRVEGFVVYRELEHTDDRLYYADFNSLYPHISKELTVPRGHPQVILNNFSYEKDAYFGVIKGTFLAPGDLLLPLLHLRTNKLFFALCRTCAENETPPPCKHDTDQRKFTGTFCTPEVYAAVARGYKILEIHEVWHYTEKFTKEDSLFREYIDLFYGLKQSASGFPHGVNTDAEREKYVKDFFDKEGVKLTNVERNEGLRAIGKLALNSAWGRMGYDIGNKTSHKYVDSYADLVRLYTDRTLDLKDFLLINDDMALAAYSKKKGLEDSFVNGSSVVAAFITCGGRLKLYSAMEVLQKDLVYVDTDGLIYYSRDGANRLQLGTGMGELCDELGGAYITEVVVAGAKSYAYKTSTGQVVFKAKGVSLTRKNADKLDFAKLKQLVKARDATERVTLDIPFSVARNKGTGELKVGPLFKSFGITFTKRYVKPDHSTLPWGWQLE